MVIAKKICMWDAGLVLGWGMSANMSTNRLNHRVFGGAEITVSMLMVTNHKLLSEACLFLSLSRSAKNNLAVEHI